MVGGRGFGRDIGRWVGGEYNRCQFSNIEGLYEYTSIDQGKEG